MKGSSYPATFNEALEDAIEELFTSAASTVEAVVAPVPTEPAPAPDFLESIGDLK